jgi:hypothetical protein
MWSILWNNFSNSIEFFNMNILIYLLLTAYGLWSFIMYHYWLQLVQQLTCMKSTCLRREILHKQCLRWTNKLVVGTWMLEFLSRNKVSWIRDGIIQTWSYLTSIGRVWNNLSMNLFLWSMTSILINKGINTPDLVGTLSRSNQAFKFLHNWI